MQGQRLPPIPQIGSLGVPASCAAAAQAGVAQLGHHALVLTRRALEEAEDVVDLVIDELIHLVTPVPLDQQRKLVRNVSPGLRMVWGVFMVHMEVNNGGFNQFFWNSAHEYVEEGSEGFRLIGAYEQVQLLGDAVAPFTNHADRLKSFYKTRHDRDVLRALRR